MMTYEDAERILCNQCIHHVHCMIHDEECEPMKRLKQPQWIPCSERLPEESGKYLGQRPYGEIIDITFSKKHQKWNANDSCPPKYAMEIVAWMPLPPVYKEGE